MTATGRKRKTDHRRIQSRGATQIPQMGRGKRRKNDVRVAIPANLWTNQSKGQIGRTQKRLLRGQLPINPLHHRPSKTVHLSTTSNKARLRTKIWKGATCRHAVHLVPPRRRATRRKKIGDAVTPASHDHMEQTCNSFGEQCSSRPVEQLFAKPPPADNKRH